MPSSFPEGAVRSSGRGAGENGYPRIAGQRLEAVRELKRPRARLPPRAFNEQRQVKCAPGRSSNGGKRKLAFRLVACVPVRCRSVAFITVQQLDDFARRQKRARRHHRTAKSAGICGKSGAIEAARTGNIEAQTRVEAAQATERRIVADIDDSELKAPRDGRVQYLRCRWAKCYRLAAGW